MTNRLAYQTGTIEIIPYTEYGEFCIVGVFAIDVEKRKLHYKILKTKKTRRLTEFFPEIERKVFIQTLKSINEEWSTLAHAINQGADTAEFDIMNKVAGADVAQALTYARGGMIRQQLKGVVLTHDIEEWLGSTFNKMVLRVNIEEIVPEEQRLTQQVGNYLKRLRLKKLWKEQSVGNDAYHARFPFTYTPAGEQQIERAIKPLFLAQDTPTKIIEHGDMWLQKVRRLNQFDLKPKVLIFPVEYPVDENAQGYEYAHVVVKDLIDEGVEVINNDCLDNLKPLVEIEAVSGAPLFAQEK